ncbi:class IV adenylate cyclase [Conexibacter woesei]|uniref:Adenylate cyclase n=1 Tax=Conexibacter woesei (strain DSM 14684 / CCUG 47730 / CIP 108061 / JCM 11494 / NBRC 100937 / ID131577) TaxID=469383 RepID=D3FCV5_CONWI|nr:class IV adenylate cyclase [Conexibacter woesei]ADB51467.1 adenylate cyclase [Conexibacter woesei DSM 14684]
MNAPRRNVELKAHDRDPARTLAVCQRLADAVDHGVLWQRDTYFHVPNGRLKLREERPGGATLIQYQRPDDADAKLSAYRLIGVADAAACRAGLDAALGTRVVVEKERRLFLWRQVRIHLDHVDGLGAFVEFEAVAPASSDLAEEHRLVAELRDALGIGRDDLVAVGYADALAAPKRDVR